MKRGRRILFNAAAAGSLIICLTAAGERVAQHWNGHALGRTSIRSEKNAAIVDRIALESGEGIVALVHASMALDSPISDVGPTFAYEARPPVPVLPLKDSWLGRLGFACGSTYKTRPVNRTGGAVWRRLQYVTVPSWFVAVSAAVLPGIWWNQRRGRRLPAGHCRACGYDLRATPARCPECGAAGVAS